MKRMLVVEVIPVTGKIGKETLSYFSQKNLEAGDVIDVPLRKKEVPAIVISSREVLDAKALIKKREFSLRKITSAPRKSPFGKDFMKTLRSVADFHASSLGAVLNTIIPKAVWASLGDKNLEDQKGQNTKNKKGKVFAVQSPREERLSFYKKRTLKTLKDGESVFLLSPTIEDAKMLWKEFSDLDFPSFLLHGKISKKKMVSTWKKALTEEEPVLVIGTPSVLSIPRGDVGLVIIERESGAGYKGMKSPYLDFRVAAEEITHLNKADLIFGDVLLRSETVEKVGEIQKSLPKIPKTEISDMSNVEDHFKKSPVIGKELAKLIEKNSKKKESLFIWSTRKGLGTTTVCSDCGRTVVCEKCAAPVVLYKEKDGNVFRCHACTEERSAKGICKNCGSWNLTALGIGIEKVEEEIKKLFPKIQVFRVDSTKTKTKKEIMGEIKGWEGSPSSVLLGTALALEHLDKVDNVTISSIDSLMLVPHFSMGEKIMRILFALSEITKNNLLIQTRYPENEILASFKKRDFEEFHKKDLKGRKKFGFPPFTVLIKLSISQKNSQAKNTLMNFKKEFKGLDPILYNSPLNPDALHLLLKIDSKKWPDEILVRTLKSLPPYVRVEVNPPRLF